MSTLVRASDLGSLHDKIVLIKSASDHHEPPTAVRGTIIVKDDANDCPPEVKLIWEVPDMFNTPAHRRTLILRDDESIRRLLASERDGTFEFTLDHELD